MDNHDPGKKMFNVTKKQSSATTFNQLEKLVLNTT